ncbi:hypothetical protein HDK90DRAFT_295898 [Phyllosticta capitalensis]|uniref:Uncharacterized protein n=1 Tax=Phyllosticta capitalensis TaxID=121624 RepID=A0ABR1YJT2_9PEZI
MAAPSQSTPLDCPRCTWHPTPNAFPLRLSASSLTLSLRDRPPANAPYRQPGTQVAVSTYRCCTTESHRRPLSARFLALLSAPPASKTHQPHHPSPCLSSLRIIPQPHSFTSSCTGLCYTRIPLSLLLSDFGFCVDTICFFFFFFFVSLYIYVITTAPP